MLMVKTYINCFLTPPYLQIPSCYLHSKGFPVGSVVKNLPANAGSIPSEDPLERETATTPVFLPRKSHKQTSLAGVHGVTKNWTWQQLNTANHNLHKIHCVQSPLLSLKVKSLSRVRLLATPWTVAHQAPPSTGFSRQQYWSGLPFPSPGDLPDPGIEPRSPALQADALTSEPVPSSDFHHFSRTIATAS